MDKIPKFQGSGQIGCNDQVHYARVTNQTFNAFIQSDARLVEYERSTFDSIRQNVTHPDCRCMICENGCINVMHCFVKHTMHSLPKLERWCDLTTSIIDGGGHLIFWSGWARPSVLKLEGRWPTIKDVQSLLARSHSSTKHVSYKFRVETHFDDTLNTTLCDFYYDRDNGTRVIALLNSLPPHYRFGKHGNGARDD
jgi:hypothetical protein